VGPCVRACRCSAVTRVSYVSQSWSVSGYYSVCAWHSLLVYSLVLCVIAVVCVRNLFCLAVLTGIWLVFGSRSLGLCFVMCHVSGVSRHRQRSFSCTRSRSLLCVSMWYYVAVSVLLWRVVYASCFGLFLLAVRSVALVPHVASVRAGCGRGGGGRLVKPLLDRSLGSSVILPLRNYMGGFADPPRSLCWKHETAGWRNVYDFLAWK